MQLHKYAVSEYHAAKAMRNHTFLVLSQQASLQGLGIETWNYFIETFHLLVTLLNNDCKRRLAELTLFMNVYFTGVNALNSSIIWENGLPEELFCTRFNFLCISHMLSTTTK